jgi:hypothetical protein
MKFFSPVYLATMACVVSGVVSLGKSLEGLSHGG